MASEIFERPEFEGSVMLLQMLFGSDVDLRKLIAFACVLALLSMHERYLRG